MLHDFVTTSRNELVRDCKAKVRKRHEASKDIGQGVPISVEQLVATLQREQVDLALFRDG